MQAKMLAEKYVKTVLKEAILDDPSAFYEAFTDGEDALDSFFTVLWEAHCNACGVALSAHPFFPDTNVYILEDTDDGFLALLTVTLPKTAHRAAVAAAIVFGSAMDPRLFAATAVTLKNGDSWQMTECRADADVGIGILHQGCDNGLKLFDPPTPQKVDKEMPLAEKRRETAFVDAVVCWCMDHD